MKHPLYPLSSQKPVCLLVLVALCVTLSGCLPSKSAPSSIAEPPLIPAPPEQVVDAEAGESLNIQAYADMPELENSRRYPPGLRDAVAHALALGVLKPAGIQERFDPERGLTYGEFREWALSYQNVLYGYQALPSAETLTGAGMPPSMSTAGLAGPMNPEKLFILPEELGAGSQNIALSQSLTREALCQLYFLLSKQTDKLSSLTRADIEKALPPAADSGQEESFSQFKDYAMVGGWAKPAVALFYKSGQLQRLFRQTSTQLTIDEGFGPQKPVSRAEAIVLLQWVYGELQPNREASSLREHSLAGTEPETLPTVSRSRLNLPDDAGKPAALTAPVSRWKSLEENGPQGSRKAMQVNGPD